MQRTNEPKYTSFPAPELLLYNVPHRLYMSPQSGIFSGARKRNFNENGDNIFFAQFSTLAGFLLRGPDNLWEYVGINDQCIFIVSAHMCLDVRSSTPSLLEQFFTVYQKY